MKRPLERAMIALCTTALITATALSPALTEEYRVTYGDGQWNGADDNDCDRSWYEIGTSDAWSDQDEGIMEVLVNSEIGSFWAWSKIWKVFQYNHSHDGLNFVYVKFWFIGTLGIGSGEANFRLHFQDVTPGQETSPITRTILKDECDFYPKKYYWHGCHTFQTHLVDSHYYKVTLEMRADVNGGFTIIDFRLQHPNEADRLVDWETLSIYHTEHSTTTWGGDTTGVLVQGEYTFEQDSCEVADTMYVRPFVWDGDIQGWKIKTTTFLDSESEPDGTKAVLMKAYDADINRGETVDMKVKFWLDSNNNLGCDSASWHPKEGGLALPAQGDNAVPKHFWQFEDGYMLHPFTMINPDGQDTLRINGLQFETSYNYVHSISSLHFDGPVYNFNLPPGDSFAVLVPAPADIVGGHIYFKYDILNAAGDKTACNAWGGHEVTPRECILDGDPAIQTGFAEDYRMVTPGVPEVFDLEIGNFAHVSPSCTGTDTFGVFVYDTEGWGITGNPSLGQPHILSPAGTWSQEITVVPPLHAHASDTDTVVVIAAYCNHLGICVPEIGDCVDPNVWNSTPYYSVDTTFLTFPEGTGVEDLPSANYLSQNYPNPFNPVTTISFGVKHASHVSLRIYDVMGRLVRVLVDERKPAGRYDVCWDGRDDNGKKAATAVYFMRLEVGGFCETKKLVLLR